MDWAACLLAGFSTSAVKHSDRSPVQLQLRLKVQCFRCWPTLASRVLAVSLGAGPAEKQQDDPEQSEGTIWICVGSLLFYLSSTLAQKQAPKGQKHKVKTWLKLVLKWVTWAQPARASMAGLNMSYKKLQASRCEWNSKPNNDMIQCDLIPHKNKNMLSSFTLRLKVCYAALCQCGLVLEDFCFFNFP